MAKTKTAAPKPLTGLQLAEMLKLLKGADSIELKLTVPTDEQRSAIIALGMDPLAAQVRQIVFFDTPDLTLYNAGVVALARRVQGKGDDSVVKLRPVVRQLRPRAFGDRRTSPSRWTRCPAGSSAQVHKAVWGTSGVRKVLFGERPIRKLFTTEQRAFYATHAPDGIGLDDLVPLGPITAMKLKFQPKEFPRPIVAELWLYPDGSRILELSTKAPPAEGFQVAAEARAYLASKGVDISGEQQTKTRTALEYYTAIRDRAHDPAPAGS
jgi:hypothetical protein